MQIIDGKLVPTQRMTISEAAARRLSEFRLCTGEVVIGRRGDMGRCAVVEPKSDGWLCGTGSMIVRPKASLDGRFAQRVLSDTRTVAAIEAASVGTTMVNLNQGTLSNLLIPLPSNRAEQARISQALSDADALIESLEQLIAKKRQLKQGAMQELLRPQDGWQTQSIGFLFHLSTGSAKSNKLSSAGRFVVMDMGSVSSDGTTIRAKRTDVEEDLLTMGDLVMPKDDIGGGQIIGKVAYIDRDNRYVLGDHVYRLSRIDSRVEALLFYFLINSHYVNKDLKKKVAGSAQLMLGRSSVLDHPVTFPSDPAEQNAIATILFDMDVELAALNAQLAKVRQLKQGMMQALLTGRIRLPIGKAA